MIFFQVVIRVRPLNQRELESGMESCLLVPPGQNSTLHVMRNCCPLSEFEYKYFP